MKPIVWGDLLESFSAWYRKRVKQSSWEKFTYRARLYLKQINLAVPFQELTYEILETWWERLECSRGVKQRLLKDLEAIADYARVFYRIENLEHRKLFVPKDYSIHRLREVRYILSFEDFGQLIAQEEDEAWRLLFTLAFTGALRVGEVRGLCPDAFDLERGTMEIYRQVCNLKGGPTLASPKAESSIRLVYLPDAVVAMVREHIARFGIQGESFLFFGSRDHSKPLGETRIDRELHRLQDLAGLPQFRFHTFRRSEASLLNEQGLSGEVISDYLGHSSFDTTRRFYIGDTVERRKRIAATMDGRLRKALGLSGGNKKQN